MISDVLYTALTMRLQRLAGRKVCERVKARGFLWKGKHVHVRSMTNVPKSMFTALKPGLYVGVVTSAKLHKSAVKRNRMRRRAREALRLVCQERDAPTAPIRLLLFPRSSSLSAPFDELQEDARRFLFSLRL
jgi:ribonuclease P protein component